MSKKTIKEINKISTKKEVLVAVKKNGFALEFVHRSLGEDPEGVLRYGHLVYDYDY